MVLTSAKRTRLALSCTNAVRSSIARPMCNVASMANSKANAPLLACKWNAGARHDIFGNCHATNTTQGAQRPQAFDQLRLSARALGHLLLRLVDTTKVLR